MVLIISIDGNIGSGKSTALNFLKDKYKSNSNIIFLEEPVNTWVEIKDENKNILEMFYENQEKYAFPFQMMAFITRYNILLNKIKSNPNSIIITERSLYTDKYVFAKMLFEAKKMNTYEYQIYNKWFNTFIANLPEHKYIYFSSSPNVCLERINKRLRTGEEHISMEYLENCDKYHNNMFSALRPSLKINLDNYDINEVSYNEMINKVCNFIDYEEIIIESNTKLSLFGNWVSTFLACLIILLVSYLIKLIK